MKRSKVALIGANPSYAQAPFDDPNWEIWGCNSLWSCCRDSRGLFRADRWFELHPMSVQTEDELRAIHACPVPIYLLDMRDTFTVKNAIMYPLGEIINRFKTRYFTCTFAYQIALALSESVTDIGLYGIELAYGTARERTVEKACVEFWIGVAKGIGVAVHLPQYSYLCRQENLYGYHYYEEVDEVNSIVDGIVGVRMLELERQGDAVQVHQVEGNA